MAYQIFPLRFGDYTTTLESVRHFDAQVTDAWNRDKNLTDGLAKWVGYDWGYEKHARAAYYVPLPSYSQKVRLSDSAIAGIVSDIDLTRFPIKLELSYAHGFIALTMHVPHRDKGNIIPVAAGKPTADVAGFTEHETLNNIRAWLMQVVAHEFHEMFLYRGERVFDPHDDNKRPNEWPF